MKEKRERMKKLQKALGHPSAKYAFSEQLKPMAFCTTVTSTH